MTLTLFREIHSPRSAIGSLFIGEHWFCYTLEDPIRERKIYGETAIPYGTYDGIVNFSNRFQKNMPLLFNQDDYSIVAPNGDRWVGIRIHSGNYPEDTAGCILVGYERKPDMVYKSRPAFHDLMNLHLKGQPFTITIKQG